MTPYQTLNRLLDELHRLVLTNNWEQAASLAEQIDTTIKAGKLGKAIHEDRPCIEQSLKLLDTCLKKAEPNKDDVALLLKGFGVDLSSH